MKPSTGRFLRMLLLPIIVAAMGTPASAEAVPAGCKGRCKQQYLGILKYNSDAFSRDQERHILRKAFGEPVHQAVGNTDQLLRYRGNAFDFFELSDGAGKPKLLGIFVKGNPAHARIPSLDMGESRGSGKPTKWYITANDLTLGYVLTDCHHQFSAPPAYFHSTVLTPSCYFGKPGGYSHYAFQYSLLNQPCLKDIETLGVSEGVKRCPQKLPAMAVYIWGENVAEDARELAEFFASGK